MSSTTPTPLSTSSVNRPAGVGTPKYVSVHVEPCRDDFLSLAIRRLSWVVYDANQIVLAEEVHCSRSDGGRGPIGRLPPAFVRAVRSLPPGDGYVVSHGMIRTHLLLRRKFREAGMQGAWDDARKCCTRNPELLRVALEDRAIGSGMELNSVYDLLLRPGETGGCGGKKPASAATAASSSSAAEEGRPPSDDSPDDALDRARKTGRIFFWYKNSPKHRHQCLDWLVENFFLGGSGHHSKIRASKRRMRDQEAEEPGTPPHKRRFKRLPQEEVPDDEMRRMTVEVEAAKAGKQQRRGNSTAAGMER